MDGHRIDAAILASLQEPESSIGQPLQHPEEELDQRLSVNPMGLQLPAKLKRKRLVSILIKI